MAAAGVLQCVGALVSAFHGGAELVQVGRERKDKKKRRKEKDIEHAVEEKMLHKSLMEAGNKCHAVSLDRYNRFGPAFDRGDAIATNELKDVMMSLQTEVLSALVIATSVDGAMLDLSRLIESAITNKNNAIRSMDSLCQRIMQQLPPRRVHQGNGREVSVRSASIDHGTLSLSRQDSEDSLASVRLAAVPAAVRLPGQPPNQNGYYRRRASEGIIQHATHRVTSPAFPYSARPPAVTQKESTARFESLPNESDEDQSKYTDDTQPKSNTSTFSSSEAGSSRGQVVSPSADERPSSSLSDDSSIQRQRKDSVVADRRTSVPYTGDYAWASQKSQVRPTLSAQIQLPSPYALLQTTEEDAETESERAGAAPEVVTKEFESMLSQKLRISPRQAASASHEFTPGYSEVHPAYRDLFMESRLPMRPEPNHVWAPLNRPAKYNNYHGFCRGAWHTREGLQEGLSICMIPNANGINIRHWKCKQCEFRSKGMNNSNALPDQVYFDKCGIRYRWLFLAKSHVRARTAYNKPEKYAYACVFCAAEGRESAVHPSLEALMSHLVSKHKTDMMTPEVLDKTKCVIGGAPDRADDWDINIPHSNPRKVSGVVSEFLMSATTGLSKYS